MDWRATLDGLFTREAVVPISKALATLVLGFLFARITAAVADRVLARRLSLQHRMIVRRMLSYGIVGVAVATALSEVGLDLSVLLGAAGVLSVAVGFASQTSASNLISGLFLLTEQPFVLGDVISVGGTVGEVVAIDLLSVKLRTFDNVQVRLPNEILLKSEIRNLTAYPIRRFDLRLRVSQDVDLARVREILLGAADSVPICLDEPRPQLFIEGYGELGIELQLSAWTARESWVDLRVQLQQRVREALVEAGIEVPIAAFVRRESSGQG